MKAGYFFADNLLFGAKYEPYYAINYLNNSNFHILGQGLFSRYYFGKNRNKQFFQTELNQMRFTSSVKRLEGNIGLGYSFFISDNVALEFLANFNLYQKEVDSYSFFQPIDFIRPEYYARQQRLEFFLGLNFYLFTNKNKDDKNERQPLCERYLKKGNKSIGVSGKLTIEDLDYNGVFEKSKFITDGIRRRHRIFGFGSLSLNSGRPNFKIYTLSHDFFMPLFNRFYFVPSFGLGPMINYVDGLSNFYFGINANSHLGFNYFFNNANIGAGFSFELFRYFDGFRGTDITTNLFLESEIFITENLAIHPILYYAVSDEPTILYFFENDRFPTVHGIRLQFGVGYYF